MTLTVTPEWHPLAAAIAEDLYALHRRPRETAFITVYAHELRDRLQQIALTPERIALLHDYASDSLRPSFRDSAAVETCRKELHHAFADGIAKALSPVMVATGDPRGLEINILDGLLSLEVAVDHVQHNYTLILEDTVSTSRVVPDMLRQYRAMRQDIVRCADALAVFLGLGPAALAARRADQSRDVDHGWEHLRPLPEQAWRALVHG